MDFARELLVVAAAGPGSPGAPAVDFPGFARNGDTLVVVVRWTQPGTGCVVPDMVSREVVVGRVPRTDGPLLLVRQRTVRAC